MRRFRPAEWQGRDDRTSLVRNFHPLFFQAAAQHLAPDDVAGVGVRMPQCLPKVRAKSARDQYRRFRRAAEAIQFIIEDIPSSWLNGSLLVVNGRRFDGAAIRRLYDADAYPLKRRPAAAH